ncbi:MAG: hypothetical protein K1Y36_12245 [Blastocatellia bacterium]|nr:hypothetical protein [Blastocatellia bacterium]
MSELVRQPKPNETVEPAMGSFAQEPSARPVMEISAEPVSLSPSTWERIVIAVALVGALVIYLLRLEPPVGLFKDDAWYLVLAQSLAAGQGYHLTNFPFETGLSYYPPLYPFLLSLVFRCFPNFPDNLLWLKGFSLVAMFGCGVLAARYFQVSQRTQPLISWLLALATMLSPAFVLLATTSVMSECVFSLLHIMTLVMVAEGSPTDSKPGKPRIWLLAGVLAGLTYLTRSIGLMLILAVCCQLGLKRQWRVGLVFGGGVLLSLGPWWAYSQFHATSAVNRQTDAQMFTTGYGTQFWHQAGDPTRPKMTLADFGWRVTQNSTIVIGVSVGGLTVPEIFRAAPESGMETLGMTQYLGIGPDAIGAGVGNMGLSPITMGISAVFSVLGLFGFLSKIRKQWQAAELYVGFSLVLIVIWPGTPFRYVLPLLPFLLFYIGTGLKILGCQVWRRKDRLPAASNSSPLERIFLMSVVGLYVFDHTGYVLARQQSATTHLPWRQSFEGGLQMVQWIKDHTNPGEVVTSDNSPFVYMFSGRKTMPFSLKAKTRFGVRYYVAMADTTPESHKHLGKVVFQPPGSNQLIVELNPEPENPTGPK